MTDKKEKSMIQYFLLFMFSFEILFIFLGILYNQVFHLKKFSEGYILMLLPTMSTLFAKQPGHQVRMNPINFLSFIKFVLQE